jgi:hypothetical protein
MPAPDQRHRPQRTQPTHRHSSRRARTHVGRDLSPSRRRDIDHPTFRNRLRRRGGRGPLADRLAWRRARTIHHQLQRRWFAASRRKRRSHPGRHGSNRRSGIASHYSGGFPNDHPAARGCSSGLGNIGFLAHEVVSRLRCVAPFPHMAAPIRPLPSTPRRNSLLAPSAMSGAPARRTRAGCCPDRGR